MHYLKYYQNCILLLVSIVILTGKPLCAQSIGVLPNAKTGFLEIVHDSIIGTDRFLINGEVYFPHQQGASNHPFYQTETWINGSIYTPEYTYDSCLIRYDAVIDRVILLYISNRAVFITLNPEIVTAFDFQKQLFRYYPEKNDSEINAIPEGYYNIVYDSPAFEMIVKWSKYRLRNEGFKKDEFQLRRRLYIITDKLTSEIKNDRQLIAALGSSKRLIKQFMRQNNIHVRISDPSEIARVISFFENNIPSSK